MIKGFRDFLFRGNVIDLAVAVVVGAAFNEVINAVVRGFVEPLIAAVGGTPNFDNALRAGPVRLGLILTAAIAFLIKAAVVYFLVVLPLGRLSARLAPAPPITKDQELLTEIRDLLGDRSGGMA